MKVVLSTIGKFHTFDLARQLHARQSLAAIFTGYPKYKLRNEGLPAKLIRSFPWVHGPYMGVPILRKLGPGFIREMEYFDKITFDAYSALRAPDCDVFVGLSGSALRTGRLIKRRGGRYVCDRGSAHIRVQDTLLREEHELWGVPYSGIDQRVIELEESEYSEADLITIPSKFAFSTFVEQGVDPQKLALLPYGVNLERFSPTAQPDTKSFDVLFVGGVSLQKGMPYLLQAFSKVQHHNKMLRIVGSFSNELVSHFRKMGLIDVHVQFLGHVPQENLKSIMSKSHVLVLPSIQDGFGMVMAQAMACACPVIATTHTGAEDLFEDGIEGLIVQPRSADDLAARMQLLADDSSLRKQLSQSALTRVHSIGGWDAYGTRATKLYEGLVQK